jgi:hypothetical protein
MPTTKKQNKKRGKYDEKLIVTGTFNDIMRASKLDAEKNIQERKEEKKAKK